MTPLVLELSNVSRQFGGVRALDNVDLAVRRGEIVGIMGANGAGKTTLFGLIAGHIKPSSGDIRVDGKSVVGLRPFNICRRGVARTFQTVRPFGGLSVFDNVMVAARFGAKRLSMGAAAQLARDLIEVVGLTGRINSNAEELTLASQKKLEIVRAVATGAHIVLLDEVLAGLTASEVLEMVEVIRKMRKDYALTLLVIEHVMRALMDLSDRILVLHHGEVIALDEPELIGTNQRVLDCYLGTDE